MKAQVMDFLPGDKCLYSTLTTDGYKYMEDLLKTPLLWRVFGHSLASHRTSASRTISLWGIRDGFRIGSHVLLAIPYVLAECNNNNNIDNNMTPAVAKPQVFTGWLFSG